MSWSRKSTLVTLVTVVCVVMMPVARPYRSIRTIRTWNTTRAIILTVLVVVVVVFPVARRAVHVHIDPPLRPLRRTPSRHGDLEAKGTTLALAGGENLQSASVQLHDRFTDEQPKTTPTTYVCSF